MQLAELVKKYLNEVNMMQLATTSGDQPWICILYFAADDQQNLFWISTPVRRHSLEIAEHSKVAAAVPVKWSYGEPIVGLQIEGQALEVSDPSAIAEGIRYYVDKFKLGETFYQDFLAGKNKHKLYKLTSTRLRLFDKINFPDSDDAQEWQTFQGEV